MFLEIRSKKGIKDIKLHVHEHNFLLILIRALKNLGLNLKFCYKLVVYANSTGWSAITEIIAQGEAEDYYLTCNRT